MVRCESSGRVWGFTLIELLVVIAVIALLMGILLPALGRVRKRAQSVRCQAQLNHLGMAVAVYASEYDGAFPRSLIPYVWIPRGIRVWELLLNHMEMGDKEAIMICPSAKRSSDREPWEGAGNGFRLYGGTHHAWWFSGYRELPEMRGSYAYNLSLSRPENRFNEPPGLHTYLVRPSAAIIRKPYTVPVILDSQWVESLNISRERGIHPPPWDNWALDAEPSSRNSHPMSCINRHHGSVNALFFDASIRKGGLKELWTLKWHSRFDTANAWTTAGGVQPEDWPAWMRKFKDY